MFKRKPISFNLDCPHQKALYEWCSQNKNFSGFVKSVLFAQMQHQTIGNQNIQISVATKSETENDMCSLVADLL